MDIQEQKTGAACVVSVSGRLDALSAPALEERLAAVVERGETRVVLDCAGMDYVSSAGLRTLLIGARSLQQKGGTLAIAALQPDCREVMEASGFVSILQCHDTREAAVAALS